MSWGKVCDTLHAHPKALDADLEAMGLWVMALSYCGAYLTDGHVKQMAALRICGSVERLEALARQLVAAGLWEMHPSGDGWQVHDYLIHNRSRADVLAEREAKRAAGRAGGLRSGEARRNGGQASAEAPASRPLQEDPNSRSRPDPDPIPSHEKKRETPAAPSSALKLVEVPPPKKARGTRAPSSDVSNEDVAVWSKANGIDMTHAEFHRFLDYWRSQPGAKGVKAEWGATWRNWLRRATEFASNGGGGGRPRGFTPQRNDAWKV